MESLVKAIKRNKQTHPLKRPYIIGIDGLSGSGKSTLTALLKEQFETSKIFHLDNYITDKKTRYATGLDSWKEYFFIQWDSHMLVEKLFLPISENKTVTLSYYFNETDSYELRTTSIELNDIIFIEGIFLQREEWRDFFDFIIYVDCPREIRDKRILKRSNYTGSLIERNKKYEERYWPAEDYYLEQFHPKETANIVIINDK